MRRVAGLRATWVALLMLTGCRVPSINSWALAPRLEVLSMGASFPTDARGELELKLRISNPSPSPAYLDHLEWEAWLDGIYFAAGIQAGSDVVAGSSERNVSFTLPIALRQVRRMSQPTTLEMRMQGTLALREEGVALHEVSFAETRTVVSRGAPVLRGDSLDDR